MRRQARSPSRHLATSGTKIPLIWDSADGYQVNVTIGQQSHLNLTLALDEANVAVRCGQISQEVTLCPSCTNMTGLEDYYYFSNHYCMNATSYPIKVDSYVDADASVNVLLGFAYAVHTPDSVFGLAPMDAWNRTNSLFDSASKFSLKIDGDDSYLLLDAVDKDVTANSTLKPFTFPTKDETTWVLKPTAVRFGVDATPWYPCGGTKENPKCGVYLSTATDKILMETSDFYTFKKMLIDNHNCTEEVIGGDPMKCPQSTSLPQVTLNIGDTSIVFDDDDYTATMSKKPGWKQVLIERSAYSDRYILGTSFLQKHYTVFDNSAHAVTLYCAKGCVTETLEAEAIPEVAPSKSHSNSGGGTHLVLTTKGKILVSVAVLVVAYVIIGAILKRFCGINIFKTSKKKKNEGVKQEADTPVYLETTTPRQLQQQIV